MLLKNLVIAGFGVAHFAAAAAPVTLDASTKLWRDTPDGGAVALDQIKTLATVSANPLTAMASQDAPLDADAFAQSREGALKASAHLFETTAPLTFNDIVAMVLNPPPYRALVADRRASARAAYSFDFAATQSVGFVANLFGERTLYQMHGFDQNFADTIGTTYDAVESHFDLFTRQIGLADVASGTSLKITEIDSSGNPFAERYQVAAFGSSMSYSQNYQFLGDGSFHRDLSFRDNTQFLYFAASDDNGIYREQEIWMPASDQLDVLYDSQFVSAPFEIETGKSYRFEFELSCSVRVSGFTGFVPGAFIGCDAAQSSYWEGIAAIISRDGQPAGNFTLTGPTGFDYRYSSPLSPIQSNPAVPEPAIWAMMIGGFGLVGAAARRRRAPVAARVA